MHRKSTFLESVFELRLAVTIGLIRRRGHAHVVLEESQECCVFLFFVAGIDKIANWTLVLECRSFRNFLLVVLSLDVA